MNILVQGGRVVDPASGRVSWVSPIAKAILKAREGDQVSLRTPGGIDDIEILSVSYPEPGRR